MASQVKRKWNPSHHPRDSRGRFTRSSTRVMKPADRKRATAGVQGFSPAKLADAAARAEWLQKTAAATPSPEGSAISRYLDGGWRDDNPRLRAGKPVDGVDQLDAAFVALDQDVMLRRTVPAAMFAHIPIDQLVGMKVRDAAPASASLDHTGPGHPGAVTMHIATPAGTRAYVNEDAGEVLLMRDTEVAVTRAVQREDGQGWDLYGVVIPRTDAPAKPAKRADDGAGDDTEPAAAVEPDGDQTDAGDGGDKRVTTPPATTPAPPDDTAEPDDEPASATGTSTPKPGTAKTSQPKTKAPAGAAAPTRWIDATTGKEVPNPSQVDIVRGRVIRDTSAAVEPPADLPEAKDPAQLAEAGELPGDASTLGDTLVARLGNVVAPAEQEQVRGYLTSRLGEFVDAKSGITATPGEVAFRDGRTTMYFTLTRDGEKVGVAKRRILVNPLTVEPYVINEALELDPSVQGAGFAARFNRRTEQFLAANGINHVRLTADNDVGGYAWARDGYDFADVWQAEDMGGQLRGYLADDRSAGWDAITRAEAQDLAERGEAGVAEFNRLMSSGTINARDAEEHAREFVPTPLEYAMLGWTPGSGAGKAAMWPGKEFMLGREWNGSKHLDRPARTSTRPTTAGTSAPETPADDETAATAGREFARAELGDQVSDTDTRYRMRAARDGRRRLDRYDDAGVKLGSLSEAPDGKWIARDADGNPVGHEPTFRAANTRIEQAAARRTPAPAPAQVPDEDWNLTPAGPAREIPGVREDGPLPETDPAVADQILGAPLVIPKRLGGLPAEARSDYPSDASGIRYGGTDADGTIRDDQGRAVGRIAGELPDEGWVRVNTAVPVATRVAGGSNFRDISVWRPAGSPGQTAAPADPAGRAGLVGAQVAEVIGAGVARSTIPAMLRTSLEANNLNGDETPELAALVDRVNGPRAQVSAAIEDALAAQGVGIGDYIDLSRVRAQLSADLDRDTVDATLIEMNSAGDGAINLLGEANQKTLTPERRAAAVSVGNQDKHLVKLNRSDRDEIAAAARDLAAAAPPADSTPAPGDDTSTAGTTTPTDRLDPAVAEPTRAKWAEHGSPTRVIWFGDGPRPSRRGEVATLTLGSGRNPTLTVRGEGDDSTLLRREDPRRDRMWIAPVDAPTAAEPTPDDDQVDTTPAPAEVPAPAAGTATPAAPRRARAGDPVPADLNTLVANPTITLDDNDPDVQLHTWAPQVSRPRTERRVNVGGRDLRIVQLATIRKDRIDDAPVLEHTGVFYAVDDDAEFEPIRRTYFMVDKYGRSAGDAAYSTYNAGGLSRGVGYGIAATPEEAIADAVKKITKDDLLARFGPIASANIGVHDKDGFDRLDATAEMTVGDLVVLRSFGKLRTGVVTRVTPTKVEAMVATPSNPGNVMGANATKGSGVRLLRARNDEQGRPDLPTVTALDDDPPTADQTGTPAEAPAPVAAPTPAAAPAARTGRMVDPQYRADYERGWKASRRNPPGGLEKADARGEADAWYDGWGDFSVGRPKWTTAREDDAEDRGIAAGEPAYEIRTFTVDPATGARRPSDRPERVTGRERLAMYLADYAGVQQDPDTIAVDAPGTATSSNGRTVIEWTAATAPSTAGTSTPETPTDTATPDAPAEPAQLGIDGTSTAFVPQDRSTIGVSARGDVGRERAIAATQQLGLFASDEREMAGQGALLDALLDMPAAAPPPAPAAPAADGPEVDPRQDLAGRVLAEDLDTWSDEQLSGAFFDLSAGDTLTPEQQTALTRIGELWEAREQGMAATVADVPDDLATVDDDALAVLLVDLTSGDGSIDQSTVDRLEAELDRRDAARTAAADTAARRALVAKPVEEHAGDADLEAAMNAATDLGDWDAFERITTEWQRREDAANAREAAERAEAAQVEADRLQAAVRDAEAAAYTEAARRASAEREQVENAMAAARAAAAIPPLEDKSVQTAQLALGDDGVRRALGDDRYEAILAGIDPDDRDPALIGAAIRTALLRMPEEDRARLVMAAAQVETPPEVRAMTSGQLMTEWLVGGVPMVGETAEQAEERRTRQRWLNAEQNRRGMEKVRAEGLEAFARYRERLRTQPVSDLTDAELAGAPGTLAGDPDADLLGKLSEIRAEADRRAAAAADTAARLAEGPAGPARVANPVGELGSITSFTQSYRDTDYGREAAARLLQARAVTVGLPAGATEQQIAAAERADERALYVRSAWVLAWYRHYGQFADLGPRRIVQAAGPEDDPDLPDVPAPLPGAKVSKPVDVWEAMKQQAVYDRRAGINDGAYRYTMAVARSYGIPFDRGDTSEDAMRRLGTAIWDASRNDPRTKAQAAASYIAEWRRLAAEDNVDPTNHLLYGPPDRRPAAKIRSMDVVATADEEIRINRLVVGGADWTEAYAQVLGLDVDRLRREQNAAAVTGGDAPTDKTLKEHYAEHVYRQWMDAEAATAGNLLNKRAAARNVDPRSLFSGDPERAYRYASEELMRWWADHPRLTFADYKEQIYGGGKAARDRVAAGSKGNQFA